MFSTTDPPTSSAPRLAATVALVRDTPTGVETFLLKRSGKSPFLPTAYVFPGGRVDPGDVDAPVVGDPDWERMGTADAISYLAAAVRECFEESGILLTTGTSEPTDRAALQRRDRTFAELARERGWVIEADALVYWAWWITPEREPRRYDTRFFIARVGADAVGTHDEYETVASEWIAPADAVERAEAGEMFLAPPTLCTLMELAEFSTVDAILAAGRLRTVPAILPRLAVEPDGCIAVVMPGDPEHPSAERVDGPTRMVLRDGRWQLTYAE